MPPGPVQVTVQAASPPAEREDTRKALDAIWAERKALGLKGRSKEEIDAEIDALRNQSEEEIRATHRIRPLDALHLAAAIESQCSRFATHDQRLKGFPDIPIELLP